MKNNKLTNFTRGWFVGGFEPSLYNTTDVEVAVQHFKKGQHEASHCHKIATEITVIVSGKVKMNGQQFETGDVITLSPGEFTDFQALEDTITTVVKLPGALNDKYLKEE
ncbi:cupin domain-containing protein [Vibrio salinus]|uniref:cupin domain-containing protein n=1 Tax=Vibrio salinus TaxID=2899784 RepID=UPI001E37AA12|nr:cupin domain-containing protein [Vibrio salinus]MCE0493771.1 cupin domain-containing protein [Vibrio salinus]